MRIYAAATMFAGVAMKLLTSPITLIILGLAALAGGVWYVVTHWDQLKASLMDSAAFKWVMQMAGEVGQFFGNVWESITLGWEMVVNFFSGFSPVAAFEGFASTIKGVFSSLFDMLKSTFASSYNWIVEKLNKIPGIDIDLKTTSSAPTVSAGAAGPSLLTGDRVGSSIPRGGLMSQVNKESKTTIDRSSRIDTVNFVMPNGMTPAQLAEWQEMEAG